MAVPDLDRMIGARLVAAIRYVRADGEVVEQTSFTGTVLTVDPLVAIDRDDGRDPFTPPPDPDAFDVAVPGVYTLPDTGEQVIDPGFTTRWTVHLADRGDGGQGAVRR